MWCGESSVLPSIEGQVRRVLSGCRMNEAVPGRLPDLLAQFENVNIRVWTRHAIDLAGGRGH